MTISESLLREGSFKWGRWARDWAEWLVVHPVASEQSSTLVKPWLVIARSLRLARYSAHNERAAEEWQPSYPQPRSPQRLARERAGTKRGCGLVALPSLLFPFFSPFRRPIHVAVVGPVAFPLGEVGLVERGFVPRDRLGVGGADPALGVVLASETGID